MSRFRTALVALGAVVLAACSSGGPAAGSRPATSSGTAVSAGPASPSTTPPGLRVPGTPAATSCPALSCAPAVGAKAFTGHGRLAFVSSGRLYVLDGTSSTAPAVLHAVAAPAGALAPAWSPDGRWLAFLVGSETMNGRWQSGTLWLAGTDGQDARPVLANAGPFSWSPTADVLAATVTDPVTGNLGLDELRPGEPPRAVSGVTGPAVWSPDGRELAFTAVQSNPRTGFTASALETVPAAGGKPVVRATSTADALILDGWWGDGDGLLAWSDPQDSGSIAADGVPLVSYPLTGGRPVTLGTTLLYPSFAVPSGPAGVILVAGGDRILWNGKTLSLCDVTSGCMPLPGGLPGPVNLDPAWTTAQEPTLAFVHGAASWPGDFSQQNIEAWYATRKLWVYEEGGNPHEVSGAGSGIADPVWSADGNFILYVRDNALWLIDPFGGRADSTRGVPSQTGSPAMRIVSTLFAGPWPNYYGYVDWHDQFAWQT